MQQREVEKCPAIPQRSEQGTREGRGFLKGNADPSFPKQCGSNKCRAKLDATVSCVSLKVERSYAGTMVPISGKGVWIRNKNLEKESEGIINKGLE